MPQTLEQIVEGIPINQKAPATASIKKELLAMLAQIYENRKVIEHEKHRMQMEKVINDYRILVGFHKIQKRLIKAKQDAENAAKELLQLGLTQEGVLLTVTEKDRYGERGTWIHVEGDYIQIPKETADRIKEVQRVIQAVSDDRQVFSPFQQLKARMIMCSRVGECAAIINAVAGMAIFKIGSDTLALPEGKKK